MPMAIVSGASGVGGSGTAGQFAAWSTSTSLGSAAISTTVLSGATQGSVVFVGSGSVLHQSNSELFWDNSNNRLGIGTETPLTTLHVAGGSGSAVRNLLVGQHVTGTAGALLLWRKSRGTLAAPTTVVTGDTLGLAIGEGYDGSNYLQMAALRMIATGTIASTRVPTKIDFMTATDAAPSVLTVALTLGADQSATFVGKVFIADGSVSAPGLAFSGASTMGFYRNSATQASLAIAGVNAFSFVKSGDTGSDSSQLHMQNPSGALIEVARVLGGVLTLANGGETVRIGGPLALSTSGDVILTRSAAAVLHLGAANAASPVAQTFGAQGSRGGTDTNVAGASLTHRTGIGTGNSVPAQLILSGDAASATSGTTAHTVVQRLIPNGFKVLTDNSAIDILSCTVANGSAVGGVLEYTIEVTDGTDYQAETGRVLFAAVNKAGTVTRTITEDADTTQSVSAGTLTSTWAISNANPAVISVNANTSLASPSTGFPRITFSVSNFGQQAVAIP